MIIIFQTKPVNICIAVVIESLLWQLCRLLSFFKVSSNVEQIAFTIITHLYIRGGTWFEQSMIGMSTRPKNSSRVFSHPSYWIWYREWFIHIADGVGIDLRDEVEHLQRKRLIEYRIIVFPNFCFEALFIKIQYNIWSSFTHDFCQGEVSCFDDWDIRNSNTTCISRMKLPFTWILPMKSVVIPFEVSEFPRFPLHFSSMEKEKEIFPLQFSWENFQPSKNM